MKLKSLIWLICLGFATGVYAKDTNADIADQFRVFVIKPERISPNDKVTINGSSATITYWESIKNQKTEDVVCNAFEWILLGRTEYGRGAPEAFANFPSINEIYLSFYEVEFDTKKGPHRAEILPTYTPYEYLKIGIKRDSFSKKSFNRKEVAKMIEDRKCADVGKQYIDSIVTNQDYFRNKRS